MPITEKATYSISRYLLLAGLSVPRFQRPYRWKAHHVIQLIEDIARFKGEYPYRIGTVVICKDKGTYQIVDGQQRTVTFLLIVKAILNEWSARITANDLRSLLDRIAADGFRPSFGNDISKANIQLNYLEIARRIAAVDEAFIRFFLEKCEVTFLVIDNISEAFQFFDAQNARGKDLEPHDLLKAYHLRELIHGDPLIDTPETVGLVERWEAMKPAQLTGLFADFLYRVKQWSRGRSARQFGKKDVHLFKGISLQRQDDYPYVRALRMLSTRIENQNESCYPFQIDQVPINGKLFFDMVDHYAQMYAERDRLFKSLGDESSVIISTLDTYSGRERTGDRYIRMLFDCALLHYIDKFGRHDLARAVQTLFIWAYTPRLRYQNLQLASVDNYVLNGGNNIFRLIKDAVHPHSITSLALPVVRQVYDSPKTKQIKYLFSKYKYI